jgi:hypothetical protein
MKTQLSFIAAILFLLCACGTDLMDQTVFIPDGKDKNLPAYTEWGYNSFGAQYGSSYFLVTDKVDPCLITYQDGILHFHLTGGLTGNANNPDYKRESMRLSFSFPFSQVDSYTDLTPLDGLKIDLPDATCGVMLTLDSEPVSITVQGGRLFFKRMQLLYIDGEKDRAILSGYFDLQFLRNGKPEQITNGRFDLGVNAIYDR